MPRGTPRVAKEELPRPRERAVPCTRDRGRGYRRYRCSLRGGIAGLAVAPPTAGRGPHRAPGLCPGEGGAGRPAAPAGAAGTRANRHTRPCTSRRPAPAPAWRQHRGRRRHHRAPLPRRVNPPRPPRVPLQIVGSPWSAGGISGTTGPPGRADGDSETPRGQPRRPARSPPAGRLTPSPTGTPDSVTPRAHAAAVPHPTGSRRAQREPPASAGWAGGCCWCVPRNAFRGTHLIDRC